MIDSYFRTYYQTKILDPLLTNRLINQASPHFFTFLASISGLFIPIFLFFHLQYIAFIFLLFSGFLDTLDGSLSRHQNKSSPKGAVFDIVSDRFVEFCIFLGLYLYNPMRGLPIIVMFGAVFLCITSFLVVGIFHKNESKKSFYYSPGLVERTEAFIFFSLMILLPNFFSPLAYLFSLLVVLTVVIRIYQFTKHV